VCVSVWCLCVYGVCVCVCMCVCVCLSLRLAYRTNEISVLTSPFEANDQN